MKKWLLNLLGLGTTLLSLLLIYMLLFKDGHTQRLTSTTLIEFAIVALITVSTKTFWYTSTENSIHTSEDYQTKRKAVADAVAEEVTNVQLFDTFIDNENVLNYNQYVSNKCANLTIHNYKYSLFDRLHRLFYKYPKVYYVRQYILKIERRAMKQHKLSSSSIRSLTQSRNGLTDDRNFANRKKLMFLTTGTIFSLVFTLITSTIVFDDKTDFDRQQALIKMFIYVSNILFSILQAVLKARITVLVEDIAYFNRILSILEKYSTFKNKPEYAVKVCYSEVINESIDVSTFR